MRIDVQAENSIAGQARTYAEYRVFAALSQVLDTSRVRHARVRLRSTRRTRVAGRVSCTVVVDMHGGGVLRIRTSGGHPYAAINRAVDRLQGHTVSP